MTTEATKRMTQSEVVKHLAERSGMKPADVKNFFDELLRLATREVETNGEFLLPGFGKVVKKETKARQGRNPATGATIQIPSRTKLTVRLNKTLKESILSSYDQPRAAASLPYDEFEGAQPPAPDAELAGDYTKGNRP